MRETDTESIEFRPAEPRDLAFLVALRNDPVSVRYSRRGALPREVVERDFLATERKRAYVAHLAGEDIGYALFERLDAGGEEIGIALAPTHRGAGLGAALVAAATRWCVTQHAARRVVAEVWPDNVASLRCFERAGYLPVAGASASASALESRSTSTSTSGTGTGTGEGAAATEPALAGNDTRRAHGSDTSRPLVRLVYEP